MQNFTLRLSVLLLTFFIGVSAVSIWFFNRQTNSDILPVNVTTTEKEVDAIESDSILTIDEEYAVYSAILADKRYKNKVIVIGDYTSHGSLANAASLHQQIASLTKDTTCDYETKNQESEKLKNNFTVEGKVIFLSEKEEKQIFRKDQDGWATFYKKYPEANGIIHFSRAGFNQKQTQALVGVSIGCGWLCGEGNFIFLQKENGKWVVHKNIGLWVS
jgi:hypothetical protein